MTPVSITFYSMFTDGAPYALRGQQEPGGVITVYYATAQLAFDGAAKLYPGQTVSVNINHKKP